MSRLESSVLTVAPMSSATEAAQLRDHLGRAQHRQRVPQAQLGTPGLVEQRVELVADRGQKSSAAKSRLRLKSNGAIVYEARRVARYGGELISVSLSGASDA
jgi:hypothetical protein